MSADKDRGIRRQKQKRAKDRKRAEKRQVAAAASGGDAPKRVPPGAADPA